MPETKAGALSKSQIYQNLHTEVRQLYSLIPSVESNPKDLSSLQFRYIKLKRLNTIYFSAAFSKLNELLDQAPHLTAYYREMIEHHFKDCFQEGINHKNHNTFYRSGILYNALDLKSFKSGGIFKYSRAKSLEQREYLRMIIRKQAAAYALNETPDNDLLDWEEQITQNYGVKIWPESE